MKVSERSLVRSICKDSFYEFLQEFWSVIVDEEPVFNWHIEVICNELQEVAERVFRGERKAYDLIINVPPGSTKSTTVSQMFPAWCWARMPAAKFICASYAHDIAVKDSIKTRDIVESDKYRALFPEVTLRDDVNKVDLFANTAKGFRLCAGVGGKLTGYHGHVLIVDDPLNPEEAYSEADLKRVGRWMSTTLPTRKVNQRTTPTILIQQRLHESDPSGAMLEVAKTKNRNIRHICLPGEIPAGAQDVLVSPPELRDKYVDGLLDPVRFPKDVLQDLEDELGPYGYAGQVMQSPVPLGGGEFEVDRIKWHAHAPKMVEVVRSWDKAGTDGGGAYSVGLKLGKDKNNEWWVLDVVRGQWGANQREERIAMVAEEDGSEVPVIVEVEGGSGGKESGQHTAANLAGKRVILYHPTGTKEARAYAAASQMGAGNFNALDRPWKRDFVNELRLFPNGKFKDQVDALSGGFNYMARKKRRVGGFRIRAAGKVRTT